MGRQGLCPGMWRDTRECAYFFSSSVNHTLVLKNQPHLTRGGMQMVFLVNRLHTEIGKQKHEQKTPLCE